MKRYVITDYGIVNRYKTHWIFLKFSRKTHST